MTKFLSTLNGFTFFVCLFIAISQCIVTGFYGGVSSTLQSKFGLTVLQISVISSVYQAINMIVKIPLTHVLNNRIPYYFRWMVGFTSFGSILFALPGILMSVNKDSVSRPICFINNEYSIVSTESCTTSSKSNMSSYTIFIIAGSILAISQSCVLILCASHINKHSTKTESSKLIGYMYAAVPTGSCLGYALIGYFIEADLWWLSFVLGGIALLLLLPFFALIPDVPSSYKVVPASLIGKETNKKDYSFKKSLKQILTNRCWWYCEFAIIALAFTLSSLINNGSLFLQMFLDLKSSWAPTLAAMVIIPSATLGLCLGGHIDNIFSEKLSHTSIWNTSTMILTCSLLWIAVFQTCPQIEYEGVRYIDQKISHFTPDCSLSHGCIPCKQIFEPVCVGDLTYFSPCHAGCDYWDDVLGESSSCSCSIEKINKKPEIVTSGICLHSRCESFRNLLILLSVIAFSIHLNISTLSVVLLKVNHRQYSSTSLAIGDVLKRLLGDIPGLLIFGSKMDGICLVRNEGTCPSSCAIYDKINLSNEYFFSMGCIPLTVAICSLVLCTIYLKTTYIGEKLYSEDEDEDEEIEPKP